MDADRDPAARRVAALILEAGQRLAHWTQDATYPAAWYAATPHRVVAVAEDGEALASVASVATCAAAAGRYYWAAAAGRVYVRPRVAGGDPRAAVVLARVRFGVATHARAGGDFPLPFAGRLVGVPELSLRVEAEFGEPAQVGGGDVELANGDGWADALAGLDWSSGAVELYLGTERVF